MSLVIPIQTTDVGRAAMVAAQDGGLKLVLSELAIGNANNAPYVPDGTETELVNEIVRVGILSAGRNGSQFNVKGDLITPEDTNFNLFEIGVFTDDGVLFGVWSHATYLTQMYDGHDVLLDLYFAITSMNPADITFLVLPSDAIKPDGTVAATADIPFGGNKLLELGDGVDDADAVNKGQLDVVAALAANNSDRLDDVESELDGHDDDLALLAAAIAATGATRVAAANGNLVNGETVIVKTAAAARSMAYPAAGDYTITVFILGTNFCDITGGADTYRLITSGTGVKTRKIAGEYFYEAKFIAVTA